MKLLKLLLHSAAAAVLFAALMALLPFYLNPATDLELATWWRTLVPLAAVQGLAVAVIWPLGLLALRFFAERPLEVRWFRFELWHRFHLTNTALAAGVWWTNYAITGALLSGLVHRRLLTGCGIITLVWALGVLLSLQRVMFRTPRPRVAQAALVAVLYSGLFLLRAGGDPAAARHPARPDLAPVRAGLRVVVVSVDGLSPEFVLPLAAEGRLPQMSRMIRDGVRAAVHWHAPPLRAAAWTTVATGVRPGRHGIVDVVRWRVPPVGPEFTFAPRGIGFRGLRNLGLIDPLPFLSGDRRAPAIWSLLDAARLRSGVVGWPVTDPPEPVRGAIVPAGSMPPPAEEAIRSRAERLAVRGDEEPGGALEALVRHALVQDLAALEEADRLAERERPAALLVHLPGLSELQEGLLRDSAAAVQRRRPAPSGSAHGEVLARYHRFLDDSLAALSGGDDPPDLVIVVSCWGVRQPPAWMPLLGPLPDLLPGLPVPPPAGLLLVGGRGVAAGAQPPPVEPAELLPTLLYYLGLPVARDLDRRPRTDLFDGTFTSRRPITFVPTYRSEP